MKKLYDEPIDSLEAFKKRLESLIAERDYETLEEVFIMLDYYFEEYENRSKNNLHNFGN